MNIALIAFSLSSPLGVLIGLAFKGISPWVELSVMSIAAGTFLYIAASDVIVEEFSTSKYKYRKLTAFVLGVVIISLMWLIEE